MNDLRSKNLDQINWRISGEMQTSSAIATRPQMIAHHSYHRAWHLQISPCILNSRPPCCGQFQTPHWLGASVTWPAWERFRQLWETFLRTLATKDTRQWWEGDGVTDTGDWGFQAMVRWLWCYRHWWLRIPGNGEMVMVLRASLVTNWDTQQVWDKIHTYSTAMMT